ncbi:DUF3122 domain-containing protein [Synechococcus sp. 1G10]|uniref:DUF3122 domain-containing protein n=1 Tax=Synechococcus sp. 1G10 TaxID=2025605 RepID=UPI000B97DA33|nr:DUF3122 domain-containing protein [Synechococcus sp. 1G10]
MSGVIRQAGRLLLSLGLVLACLFALVKPAAAQLHAHPSETGSPVLRSLVSVRDLDDQAWQLVAFRDGPPGAPLRLRVVGYPGKVRLDHPTALQVRSGPFQWQLEDLTLENQALSNDGRAAAAEFDLSPLLAELSQNRPLRLRLPGVFTELPVPPFVVAEWRSLVRTPA